MSGVGNAHDRGTYFSFNLKPTIEWYFHFLAADNIGLPYPPPYLAPTSHGKAILQGVNYASGAGGLLDESGANYVS